MKRHLKDTISGTVISVSAKCSLEPIAFRILDPVTGEYGPVHLTEKRVNWPNYPPPEDVPPPPLIHDVPLSDVRHYEDLTEGDYVVYRQKVGVIQQINRDVVLLLRNQTVVLPNASSFETPLPFGSRPIVSLPSPQEDLKSYPLEKDEVLWAEHSDTIYPGQFIMTDAKSLRTGDWVSGSYSDSELPEGHVLATPALDVHVDWVCPNVFAVGMPYVSPDSEVIRWSTLQGEAVRCDFGKLPGSSSNGQRVGSDAWLCIGDRVTFRDPADAAAKYPQFQPIPADQTWGYNLNIFRIVSTKTEVRVQWQDLSVTTEDATALRTFTSLQDEVWPGELVALREGTDRIPNPSRERPEPLSAHFQGYKDDNILVPKKIGVVQAVDSGERIASVRWYKDPKVELLHDGYILRPSSVLGELGDEITDVSMYELTKHSGLGRARGDMVLVVPDKIHESLIPSKSHGPSSTAAGPCPLSYLFPITFWQLTVYLHYMKMVLVELNWFKSTVEIDSTPLPPRHSVHRDDFSLKSPVNFVGRIIALDLDGTITVRLAAANNCRDVRVPLEKILMVIDDEDMPQGVNFPALHVHNLDIYEADDTSILQSIEYEGGQRIDNDSGDDMWTTEDDGDDGDDGDEDSDEEDDGDNVESEVAEIKVPDKADSEKDETESSQGKLPAAHDNELPILSMQQPTVCPPSFTVLDTSPPSDHVFLSKPATEASRTRIKRIRKEYQILESSLPLGIFARTWESRIDLLRVLIIGPQGTPYEYAPYIIDFYFGEDFPNVPPASFFHSWTNGMGRINPNLYEDGKICLSILGTWPSQKPGENWSPVQSTVLQILVSLMGLVLVKVPFYSMYMFSFFFFFLVLLLLPLTYFEQMKQDLKSSQLKAIAGLNLLNIRKRRS